MHDQEKNKEGGVGAIRTSPRRNPQRRARLGSLNANHLGNPNASASAMAPATPGISNKAKEAKQPELIDLTHLTTPPSEEPSDPKTPEGRQRENHREDVFVEGDSAALLSPAIDMSKKLKAMAAELCELAGGLSNDEASARLQKIAREVKAEADILNSGNSGNSASQGGSNGNGGDVESNDALGCDLGAAFLVSIVDKSSASSSEEKSSGDDGSDRSASPDSEEDADRTQPYLAPPTSQGGVPTMVETNDDKKAEGLSIGDDFKTARANEAQIPRAPGGIDGNMIKDLAYLKGDMKNALDRVQLLSDKYAGKMPGESGSAATSPAAKAECMVSACGAGNDVDVAGRLETVLARIKDLELEKQKIEEVNATLKKEKEEASGRIQLLEGQVAALKKNYDWLREEYKHATNLWKGVFAGLGISR